jgi:hypothetical protein
VKFNHSTRAQFLQALRARYKQATGVEAVALSGWISANVTVPELRTAFGLTLAQANALKTRIDAKAAQLASLKTAAGE